MKKGTRSAWRGVRTLPAAVSLTMAAVVVLGGCGSAVATPQASASRSLASLGVQDPSAAPSIDVTAEPSAFAVDVPSAVPTDTATPVVSAGPTPRRTARPTPRSTATPVPDLLKPTGSMFTARRNSTAVRLNDGRVLVIGGDGTNVQASFSAEIYDPATGKFQSAGSTADPRVLNTTTLLQDGRVLICGGEEEENVGGATKMVDLATAEIYDPATGRFTITRPMTTPRAGHTATLLTDGEVLIAGGFEETYELPGRSAEVYDPVAGTFTATGSMPSGRFEATATRLPDGRVLVAGGKLPYDEVGPQFADSAVIYDPATGKFTATGSLNIARDFATATPLPDGRVAIIGGSRDDYVMTLIELYDPSTGLFAKGPSLPVGRTSHTATLLQDGQILILGGRETYDGLLTVFLYEPVAGL